MELIKLIYRKIEIYMLRREAKLAEREKKPFREKYPNFPLYFSAIAMLIALIAQFVAILKV